jgi:hypothetical protein
LTRLTHPLVLVVLGLVASLCYVAPWILTGEGGYVFIHDGLDQLASLYVAMARGGFWFAPNLDYVGPIFDTGLPRVSYLSELRVNALLYALLPPYWAYIAIEFMVHALAFIGAGLLLNTILPASQEGRRVIILGIAACYSTLPFWVWTGGVAALPFVAYAAMRAWRRQFGPVEALLLAAYPLVSDLTLTGYLVVASFWLFLLVSLVLKRLNIGILLATLVTSLAHLVVDHRLIEFALFGGFVAHRAEFDLQSDTMQEGFRNAMALLTRGDYYSPSYHGLIVAKLVPIAMVLSVACIGFARIYKTRLEPASASASARGVLLWLIAGLLAWMVGVIFVGYWFTPPMQSIAHAIPILQAFNPTRVSALNGFAWLLIFALSSVLTATVLRKWSVPLLMLIFAGQCYYQLTFHEYLQEQRQAGISYGAFFSEPLFERIGAQLPADRSSFLVGSIGIHPSIAQYNGFRTIDSYSFLYPLAYKARFRAAIAGELAKDPVLASYFDNWGSRLYLFVSEARCTRGAPVCRKDEFTTINQLDVDILALKALGTKYLFSLPTIANADALGLTSLGTFEDDASAWRITVYQLP